MNFLPKRCYSRKGRGALLLLASPPVRRIPRKRGDRLKHLFPFATLAAILGAFAMKSLYVEGYEIILLAAAAAAIGISGTERRRRDRVAFFSCRRRLQHCVLRARLSRFIGRPLFVRDGRTAGRKRADGHGKNRRISRRSDCGRLDRPGDGGLRFLRKSIAVGISADGSRRVTNIRHRGAYIWKPSFA